MSNMTEFSHFRHKIEDISFPSSGSFGASSMQFAMGQMHPQAGLLRPTTFSQVHASSNACPRPLGLHHNSKEQAMSFGQGRVMAGDVKLGQYDPNLYSTLADIQQRIGRMQEFVRMNEEAGRATLEQRQQVASAVSLISQVTAAIHEGILNQSQTQNVFVSESSQLSHLFNLFDSPHEHDHGSSAHTMVVGNGHEFSPLSAHIASSLESQTKSVHGVGAYPPHEHSTNDQVLVYGGMGIPHASSIDSLSLTNLQAPQANNRIARQASTMDGVRKASVNRSSPGVPAPSSSGSQGSEESSGLGLKSKGSRDENDDGEGEILAPGSYQLVELQDREILAEHTHFCELCGKGFKRDANLRMHMRSHGDEYKTPEALARPPKLSDERTPQVPKRYSCPYVGCKRNVKHRKFQPLKSLLCVKNHYRRSHCAKNLTCSKCKVKKFSVVADLKTHEKHCGCDKWQCSCGTTFSRKDKLFGHVNLFVGHAPAALPLPENSATSSSLDFADLPNSSNVDRNAAAETTLAHRGLDGPISIATEDYAQWTQQLF